MIKYLYISEYSLLDKKHIPEKLNNEYEFKIDNSLIRGRIFESTKQDLDCAKEEACNLYDSICNQSRIADDIIPLDDIIIYDNLDINDKQEIAYVFECPICLTKIITSDSKLNICPRCENTEFDFDLLALINTKQVEDLSNIEDNDENNEFADNTYLVNDNINVYHNNINCCDRE